MFTKPLSLAFSVFCLISTAQAQVQPDTNRLKEVVIRSYFSEQPLLRTTGAYGLVDSTTLSQQQGTTLLPALNTIAGVRMEERSPGSYRLSIRGSLLRSPFGIRNVKVYLDEFPLTDAGGNTYLNGLDAESFSSVRLLKGPQSGVYGANSGGVAIFNPLVLTSDSTLLKAQLQGGSFGLFKEHITLGKQYKNYQFSLVQAYQRSDGYREHSAMDRKYIQLFQQLNYSPSAQLKALVFYSDLHYDTPGGLTAAQFAANPAGARPATAVAPGAVAQQAGIYAETIYAGISNTWRISERFRHVASFFRSYTDFKNPFITNYEHRKELTYGLRTYLEYEQKGGVADWRLNVGLESSRTNTDFNNYDNAQGTPAAIQAADQLNAGANFAFAHLNIEMGRLLAELSASVNLYRYKYESLQPVAVAKQTNQFDAQLMPRLALSYRLHPALALYGSVSKGYSPPTLAEVRASDQIINVDLQPEYGWNYETGVKFQSLNRRVLLDLTGFYYRLSDAIVRRVNESDTEYYINAGGTRQWGLETAFTAILIPQQSGGFVRGLTLRNAVTLSRFKFNSYVDAANDYSGNNLTGVPKRSVVSNAELQFPQQTYLFLQHNYTSAIPLNDANTVYANSYHLVQAKAGIRNVRVGKQHLELFAGVDNLLNKTYSLGNDLNAFGGRYFNAAAPRNYYAGVSMNFR